MRNIFPNFRPKNKGVQYARKRYNNNMKLGVLSLSHIFLHIYFRDLKVHSKIRNWNNCTLDAQYMIYEKIQYKYTLLLSLLNLPVRNCEFLNLK